MLSYKLDFSSCAWKLDFVKSSHICPSSLVTQLTTIIIQFFIMCDTQMYILRLRDTYLLP